MMKQQIKNLWSTYTTFTQARACRRTATQLSAILKKNSDPIPVLVVSYRNSFYVENMVSQLNTYELTPIIIDNNSKDSGSQKLLQELEQSGRAQIVRSENNLGHMVGFLDPLYRLLPAIFAYTDPDLELSPKLPPNFLEILADLTIEYSTFKAGLALDLLPKEPILDVQIHQVQKKPFAFSQRHTVREWEQTFWRFHLPNSKYELYAAAIDTTFAVYRKANYRGNFFDAVRVAGDFQAVHTPWFPERDMQSKNAKEIYKTRNVSSTWTRAQKCNPMDGSL